MKPRFSRRRAVEIAVGVVTGIVVVLLVLIGIGVLVLPSSGPASVTVTEVQWTIHQGTTGLGYGWFGPSTVNVTDADGLPLAVASGTTFSLSLVLSNIDTSNHTIESVSAAGPFRVVGTSPGLPSTVPSGSDDWSLFVTVAAPAVSSGVSYTVALAVYAN